MKIRTFTIIVMEEEDGKRALFVDGSLPIKEAIYYSQEALLKMVKKQAVEEEKRKNESTS